MWKPELIWNRSSTLVDLPRTAVAGGAGVKVTDGDFLRCKSCATSGATASNSRNAGFRIRFKFGSLNSQQSARLLGRDGSRAKNFLDVVLDLASPFQPERLIDNVTAAVNIKSFRHKRNTAVSIPHRFLPNHNGIVHIHALRKLRNLLDAGVIHSHPKKLQPGRPILFLQIHKPGHLNLARGTPGR